MIRCVEIRFHKDGPFLVLRLDQIPGLNNQLALEDGEDGDLYELKVVDKTQEELDALGEFDGF